MEAVMIFLAFSTYMNFKVYQIDVKSAFLNGKMKEEVYVKQPLGFESSEFPDYVCKLNKALYGLKQEPRAWYETLFTFLIQNKYAKGRIDNTLFIYKLKGYVLLVQVYDDKGILICQEQYTKNLLKKYEISNSSLVKTPMVPPNNLGPDLAGKPVNETLYRGMIGLLMYLTATRPDIQFSTVLCKSTSCACQILSGKLVCWSAKKQQSVAMSSVEAEYVADAGCCASILWMKIQLGDYDIHYKMLPIFCDDTNAIAISNNPVLGGNYSSTNFNFTKDPSNVPDIELTAHMIAVNSQKDSVSLLSLVPTLPKLQGPKILGALSKRSKRPKDKDSGGNIPLADMEPIHTSVADPFGTGAKYQDELDKDSDEEEVLATGEDMDEDPHDAKEVDTPPKQDYDLYKGMDVITQLLKDINNAVKDDPATNKKIDEAIKTFAKISTQTAEILSLGENATNTATEDPKMVILISSIQPTEVPPTQAKPITTIITHHKSSQVAPSIDKGKGIATETEEDHSKKLVPLSTIIHPDPDEPVKVKFMINGRMVYLTKQEIQEY
nr:retrovirus-related Pol polyprotein from transposon TNT 1-94 [Tanacetum cinerariifolium]